MNQNTVATSKPIPVTSPSATPEVKDALLDNLKNAYLKAVIEGNKQAEREITKQIKELVKPPKEQRELKPVVTVGSYKGREVLELSPWENASMFEGKMSFGKTKARLIVACIDHIRKFAESK